MNTDRSPDLYLTNQGDDRTYNKRYSHENPPQNEEEALVAVRQKEVEITKIETDLTILDANSYPNTGNRSYSGWKRSASRALSLYRTEVQFLNRWLKEFRAVHNPRVPKGSNESYSQEKKILIQTFIECAQGLANDLAKECGELLSINDPPKNRTEAEERSSILIAVKLKVQDSISKVSNDCIQHKFDKTTVSMAKAPLQRLCSQLEQKLLIVRDFKRQEASKENNWMNVIFQALSRAVDGGFALTDAEKIIFYQMKSKISL